VHAWRRAPVVEAAPEPEPVEGETLVAVEAAAVAHIDLTVASGTFAFRPELPYVPGTEGAGRVVRSGRFEPGTRVHVRGGGVGLRRDGTWAERVTVPDDALAEVSGTAPRELAATFFSPCVTARAALDEVGGLEPGERVAVAGAGGAVGAVTVQLAARSGATEVVAIERDAERAAAVPDRDGVRVVHGSAALEDLEPVDLLVDTVGGAGLAERVTSAVRPGGRAVLVGYVAGVEASFHLPSLLAADVRLLPMNLIRWERRLRPAAGGLLDALERGEIELPVTVVRLHELPDALERMRAGAVRGRLAVLTGDHDEGSDT
jgi:NADPH:quinone reductase-like Zn-dependent oxidoreductase